MASMQRVSTAPGNRSDGGFPTLDDRHGQVVLRKAGVDIQHHAGAFQGLLGRGVGRMALLPEKLAGPEKDAGPHLPAHHVGPLVDEQRQIPVAS